jgi:CRISPR-associated Csx3 family protein
MDIDLKVIDLPLQDYIILDFTCKIIEPNELATYIPPDPVKEGWASKGVIICGAIPQWLLAYFVHVLHPTQYIAVSVPRSGEHLAVVTSTHCKQRKTGDLIDYIYE